MIRRRPLPLRCAIAAVVVAFTLAACGPPANDDRAGLAFGECPPQLASQLAEFASGLAPKVDLRCGQLVVPLDYAHPEGEQIAMQIIRARYKEQSDRIGSLIFNPGGPGFPGLPHMPLLLSWLPESLLTRFDLVSLDPPAPAALHPSTVRRCPTTPKPRHRMC